MNARREIFLFLGFTLLFSSGFYLYLFLAASPVWNDPLSGAFMWCPGLSAILTRLITTGNLRGLGWGWGGTGKVLLGILIVPLLLAGAVYVAVWTFGLGAFDPTRVVERLARIGLRGAIAWAALPVVFLVGVVTGTAQALGEELGWRGLLADRLLTLTSFSRTSLLVGFIWSAWHYPLMIVLLPRFRPGLPLPFATVCFTASVVGVSFFYTWLRQRTGSVWPAAILHSASNASQYLFEVMTRDTGISHYLTFEYGIGFTLVIWIFLALFWKRFSPRPGPLPVPSPAG